MAFELFAQTNQQEAREIGVMIGVTFAVVLCSCIPLVAGLKKNQPALAIIGAICSGASALLLGCLLGLPVAGVFVVIINLVGKSNDSLSRRRDDDELEAYRRRRERGVIDDNDDDDDDEPRSRRRRDDDDDNDDDAPRPRRRRDYD